jgi:pullulanase/glycogen debranching enzyme
MSLQDELDELDVPVYEQDNHLNQFYWEEVESENVDLTEALK